MKVFFVYFLFVLFFLLFLNSLFMIAGKFKRVNVNMIGMTDPQNERRIHSGPQSFSAINQYLFIPYMLNTHLGSKEVKRKSLIILFYFYIFASGSMASSFHLFFFLCFGVVSYNYYAPIINLLFSKMPNAHKISLFWNCPIHKQTYESICTIIIYIKWIWIKIIMCNITGVYGIVASSRYTLPV